MFFQIVLAIAVIAVVVGLLIMTLANSELGAWMAITGSIVMVVCGVALSANTFEPQCVDLGYTEAIERYGIDYCVSFGLEPRIMRLDAQETTP